MTRPIRRQPAALEWYSHWSGTVTGAVQSLGLGHVLGDVVVGEKYELDIECCLTRVYKLLNHPKCTTRTFEAGKSGRQEGLAALAGQRVQIQERSLPERLESPTLVMRTQSLSVSELSPLLSWRNEMPASVTSRQPV
eukprot:5015333-Pyramimonas_sp.AAC.1